SSNDHSSFPPAIANIIGTTHVLELNSHTYYEYGSFESFTCWKIKPAEVVEESACSSMVDAVPAIQALLLKRLSRHPSVSTSSKPTQGKKNKGILWPTLNQTRRPKFSSLQAPAMINGVSITTFHK
nr:hypothetical protein [Tanacetum cinerariifolium]